jgi:hypothetical protein
MSCLIEIIYIYIHTYIHILVFSIVELLEKTRRGGEEEGNGIE